MSTTNKTNTPSEVFAAVKSHVVISAFITSSSPVDGYESFGGI
jgi:hypothetical protein